MLFAPAKLTAGSRTLATGDRVQTPMGIGTVIGFEPLGDLSVFVRLDAAKTLGRKFWFAFDEVQPAPATTEHEPCN